MRGNWSQSPAMENHVPGVFRSIYEAQWSRMEERWVVEELRPGGPELSEAKRAS